MEAWIDTIEEECLDWYRLTPAQRWQEATRLWETFVLMGGRLDDEPDSQSPFHNAGLSSAMPLDGRPGLHILRRSGV